VRSEVGEQTRSGTAPLTPAIPDLGPEPVPIGFEQGDLAEFRQNLAQSQEIRRPAPVVEDGEHSVRFAGEGDQCIGFVERDGERLIDDDMVAAGEGFAREREVTVVRGGDDEEVAAIEQLLNGADPQRVLPRGEYGAELDPVAGTDQRFMEDGAGEAVADEASPYHRSPLVRA
jgi:hypothetical protein